MGFKFNPITGQLDLVGGASSPAIDTSALIETVTLASDTSALRAVYSDGSAVAIADNAIIDTARVYGITLQGGFAGNQVKVITAGHLQDLSFSFTPNKEIFLGSSGGITETAAVTGVHSPIGLAITTDIILVRISVPVQL